MKPVVGIDVGGSKIAAGVVDVRTGRVFRELLRRSPLGRGSVAVLHECVAAATELAPDGAGAIGIGICELVDVSGTLRSAATIDWRNLDIAAAFARVGPVRLESDVRAAGRAEARFGAGRLFRHFIYLSVGTGVSYCLLVDGEPYAGAHGNALIVGAPPVEHSASGAALARRAGVARAEDVFSAPAFEHLVAAAAADLGLAVATLVNALDPEAVVIGGGLGLVDRYRDLITATARCAIEAEMAGDLPIVRAGLGTRSGLVGAALAAVA
jgi:glucokinase